LGRFIIGGDRAASQKYQGESPILQKRGSEKRWSGTNKNIQQVEIPVIAFLRFLQILLLFKNGTSRN